MTEVETSPIGDVLNGLEIKALPESTVALEATMMIKAVDADGDICYHSRHTLDLPTVEALGMVTAQRELLLDDVHQIYDPE